MDKHKQHLPSSKQPVKTSQNWMVYSGMAFEMLAIIGVFAALGFFLDNKLHTNPILVIVFLMIGLTLSFYRVFKQLS